jgi:hypothetical protein
LRPILAGLVEHEGVVVSRIPGEPVVDEKTFMRMRAVYEGRRRGQASGRQYLGSGLCVCGVCGRKLTASSKGNKYPDGTTRAQYACRTQRRGCGKVYIDVRAADAELRALTIARLSDSRFAQAISAARAQVSERLADVDKEIAEIKKVQSALAERVGRREMTLDEYTVSSQFLTADLAELEQERDALSGGAPEGPTVALSADEIARQWDGAEITEKRALLVQACGPDEIRVVPSESAGKRMFTPDRMKLVNPATPYGVA